MFTLRLFRSLIFWVIVALVVGILYGMWAPAQSLQLKPYTITPFIQALKWLVGPIIFVTIITGVVGLESLRSLGTLGVKAVIYFEVVSTLALAVGVGMGELMRPGHGMHLDVTHLDPKAVAQFTDPNATKNATSLSHILLNAIPHDPITPFLTGNTLQVLFMAVVISIVLSLFSLKIRQRTLKPLEKIQDFLFIILKWFMWTSPIATFGAMAFLVAKFGLSTLTSMIYLLFVMLLSCCIFIFLILGVICYAVRINVFKFMRFISREILLVFATSSSESVIAPMMRKLEKAGIDRGAVGLILPVGYSFNLDCTNIYLSLCVIFLSQAFDIPLTFGETMLLIVTLMVTSKGAVGVTGSGFIVLVGTLSAMGAGPHAIPAVTVAVLLGVDKFMSEMRAAGNLCGNAICCVIVSLWDKKIDMKKFRHALDHPKEYHVM